ncbi:hypothetical protein AB0P13_26520 [Rhodococcus pyridinivorans]|uniref:hypothetical protein n=1 Tax=Rhodococcus TaxID=1827 RepID=UPI001C7DB40B|nr:MULTISPECIES: hypothetical protein [unclassified Rhodococcus (in: high G+C Gram-positive bacteria)]MBX4171949.1 hypothetical protein [Rhodococcus sp. DMU2021]MCK8675722.1 hypothetical protein [Rhodococcus sp. HM1]
MTTPPTPTDSPATSADDADPGMCPWCANPVPQHAGAGRPRVWCSDQCRRDAYSARKASRSGAVGVKVVRQTRIVEKPVEVRVPDWRETVPSTPARYLEDHEVVEHVIRHPELLARVLESFSGSIAFRRHPEREYPPPLHKAAVQLAHYLDQYLRETAPPPPETAGLSRQQRRALERKKAKKGR